MHGINNRATSCSQLLTCISLELKLDIDVNIDILRLVNQEYWVLMGDVGYRLLMGNKFPHQNLINITTSTPKFPRVQQTARLSACACGHIPMHTHNQASLDHACMCMSPQTQACKQDLQAKLGAPPQQQAAGLHHKPLQQLSLGKGVWGLGHNSGVNPLLMPTTPSYSTCSLGHAVNMI